MKNALLALSFCLLAGLSWSQKTPGFQGHRLSVVYDLSLHPRFDILTGANGALPPTADGTIPFAFSHSIGLDYVLNRRASIGLSYQFFSFSAAKSNNYSLTYSGSAQMIGINFKRFRMKSNAIAPFGKYVKPELILYFYSGSYQNVVNGNSYYGTSTTVVNGNFNSGPHIGFSYSLGRNYIVLNRLIIDRGVRFSINNMWTAATSGSFTPGGHNQDPAATEIVNNQWINFYVGIGFLP